MKKVTLLNINECSLQEIFDYVANHLIKQGKRAIVKSNRHTGFSCVYLASDGTTCAIGCLIPRDIYRNDIEGLGVENMIKSLGLKIHWEKIELLNRLQNCHDNYPRNDYFIMDVRNGLQSIAIQYSLNVKVLKEGKPNLLQKFLYLLGVK